MNVKPIKQKDMYIKLEKDDYKKIARAIANTDKENGTLCIDIDGLEFEVIFSKNVDGYIEDDYHNGTGAFVCTMAEVFVKDIICDNFKVFFVDMYIESLAEEMLKR